MRIVCTLNDQKQGRTLSSFLANEGIENQLEITTNTDWGSPNYGDVSCKIWVIDEDQFEPSMKWIDEFQKDPENPIFQNLAPKGKLPIIPGSSKESALKLIKVARRPPPMINDKQPLGTLTLYFLIVCCLLFAICEITAPPYKPISTAIPPTPVFSAPAKKLLLFDYPQAYEIIDKIVALFGVEKLQNLQELPPEGQYLFQQYQQTPYWQGYYEKAMHWLKGTADPSSPQAPLFEKIRQGEVWRLFTPSILHNDLLHLFFNMIWLVVLGKQIEQRLGLVRYFLFVIITGIVTNIAQYLMSGANFIGFSGILCAMLTFIWIRQKQAAWEGYQLQSVTMAFMMFFILTMFLIQLISFSLEAYNQLSISPGIANTAHLTGAILGYILGRFNFFSWKT